MTSKDKDTHPKTRGTSDEDPRTRGVAEGEPEPVVRTGTLPVEARSPKGDPVGHARHAETPEETKKVLDMERAIVPPPGSRNYVAGQPVNEEEYEQTQEEAARLAAKGRELRSDEEKQTAKNTPGDPDYDPDHPDHPDTASDRRKKRG
jgi:hypothetical protein